MSGITSYMTADHKKCDDIFVEFENNITSENWSELAATWQQFTKILHHHLTLEESILFPEFERATGMTQGPSAVMRAEHEQIRGMLNEIEKAVNNQDSAQCQGVADTLMIMIQQHNMKEEQMLYPMCDQHLDAQRVLSALKAME